MSAIEKSQYLSPEHYPEIGGDDWMWNDEYYDGDPNIPQEVMDEVEKELEEMFKDYPRGMGFCHVYWHHKKQALAARGYRWESPQDIANADPHNRIIYD
ncbi:MAG: hypothetical protein IJ195_04945 [Lachnospiraceae bacterium]|nr:hypothetical protein [Lachnospiraceae bacterium]